MSVSSRADKFETQTPHSKMDMQTTLVVFEKPSSSSFRRMPEKAGEISSSHLPKCNCPSGKTTESESFVPQLDC